MSGLTAFVYSKNYLKYFFGETHPFQPIRSKLALELLKKLKVFDSKAKVFEARMASEEELQLVHSRVYIDFVKEMSEKGSGFLDYGDTPATKGIFEGACSRVGGTLTACDLIMQAKALHAFNPGGGLHHALPSSASGFCVFNDVAIAIRYLQRKYKLERIAVIDIDGHHGDGTQKIFYSEPILKISFHRIGIFPGTGYIEEIGRGKGKGYSVNVPLPAKTFDEVYLYAFNEVAIPLIEKYNPEIIVNQFGVDAHFQDPLVGLALTTRAYEEIARKLHELAHKICEGKYLILGGGGYNIDNVVKCWALMFLTVSEVEIEKEEYGKLHDRVRIEKDEKVFEIVKERVEKIKEVIFPLHGLA